MYFCLITAFPKNLVPALLANFCSNCNITYYGQTEVVNVLITAKNWQSKLTGYFSNQAG